MSTDPRAVFAAEGPEVLPLFAVRAAALASFSAGLPPASRAYLVASGFAARAQELCLLPSGQRGEQSGEQNGGQALAGAVLGLAEGVSAETTPPAAFGDLAFRLPENSVWRLMPGDYDPALAALGFALGAYRFTGFKRAQRAPARLVLPHEGRIAETIEAIYMGRDLINLPANHLGPSELAYAVAELGKSFGAAIEIIADAALKSRYPALDAVGRGSARAPRVAILRWAGSKAGPEAPLVALCGKGVCFDSGGYDLKPSSAMQRMKKDMGGAASVMAAARMIMAADLPVRLALRIGCVENSVSGHAMRPLDVLATRKGLSVEVGNTDAEGRLVLADLLAEACEENPALLIDCATLTGAARAALGPDLPALFSNDPVWAERLVAAGRRHYDPLWQLPLWGDYGDWLKSNIADLNNISGNTHAGAVVAALFLERFIASTVPWVHIDLYAWNETTRPGRPEGGEIQAARAIFAAVDAGLSASRAVIQ